MDYDNLVRWHDIEKEHSLFGRYITATDLSAAFEKHSSHFDFSVIGESVEGKTINAIKLGRGSIKILAWSQMHGNESTTTKAVFDLLNFLSSGKEESDALLDKITLLIIPMLNPDGAERYTRLNANGIDLNRDAQLRSQPESEAFYKVYTDFKPDFAFNLHGQRTVFGVGEPPKSAVISLLCPSQDENRLVTPERSRAMSIIASINEMLQQFLPQGVGRYDDSFNLNCVGDTLQQLGIPTILFEAGHFPGDYDREQTRIYIFLALIKALESIVSLNEGNYLNHEAYFDIPENKKCYFDHIVRGIDLPDRGISDLAIQFEEKLIDKKLHFEPKIADIGDLFAFSGHVDHNFNCRKPKENPSYQWKEGNYLRKISAEDDFTITFSVNLTKTL
ncbi:MAG: M14 metallopeptidase family protein [Leeuwenhoekiella sp.]